MCIIFLAIDSHPEYSLVLAANRDEYVTRPTETAHLWGDPPMIAGRDMEAGGTWLAAAVQSPRFGALTNVAGSQAKRDAAALSRGSIIGEWCGAESGTVPSAAAEQLLSKAHGMAGFNALLGDILPDGRCRVCHVSNRSSSVTSLAPGVHGLANGTAVDPGGYAIECGKAMLSKALAAGVHCTEEALVGHLLDTICTDPAYFLPSSGYCTRSSAALLIAKSGAVTFAEVDRVSPIRPQRTLRLHWRFDGDGGSGGGRVDGGGAEGGKNKAAVSSARAGATEVSDQSELTAEGSAASTSSAATDDWKSLLELSDLGHLSAACVELSFSSTCERAVRDRAGLLSDLKERLGSSTKLAARQQVATLLAKHAKQKLGLVPPPASQSAAATSSESGGGTGPLTVAGKRDGFGAQLMAQMSGVAFCHKHNRSYVHTPLEFVEHLSPDERSPTPAEMDAFGGMGVMSGQWSELSELEKARVEVRPFCEQAAKAPDIYFTEEVRALLRRKHMRGVGRALRGVMAATVPDSSTAHVVVVHIRRGDVTREAHPARFTDDERYIDLLPALAQHHRGARLLLLSEGQPASFDALVHAAQGAGFAGVELRLDGDPREAFRTMVEADALVLAKSAFSYAAGVLSQGVVYADLVRTGVWGWHRPLAAWSRLA